MLDKQTGAGFLMGGYEQMLRIALCFIWPITLLILLLIKKKEDD